MADVRPFRGLRYNPGLLPDLATVICPPYDVISPELQEALYRRSPYNIVRLEYSKEEPGSNRYTTAARLLAEWRQKGVLLVDSEPAFYLLQEHYTDSQEQPRTRHAVFGRVRLEKFSKGVVLPHEETREEAKRDRLQLLSASKANLSPIMGLYRDPSGQVKQALYETQGQSPLYQVAEADGEHFTLWGIPQGPAADAIQGALGPLPIYLADGHHRYETAIRYRDSQGGHAGDAAYVMMALIDLGDPGLQLLGYHRLLGGLDTEEESLLARYLAEAYEEAGTVELAEGVEEAARQAMAALAENPSDRQAIGVVDREGRRFRLMALQEEAQRRLSQQNTSIPELAECDAWTLQEGVLNPLLSGQPTARLEYAHDEVEVLGQLREGLAQVALLLRPLSLELFEAVVRKGVRLPPKSTYFSPKLPTGFVVYAFGG